MYVVSEYSLKVELTLSFFYCVLTVHVISSVLNTLLVSYRPLTAEMEIHCSVLAERALLTVG